MRDVPASKSPARRILHEGRNCWSAGVPIQSAGLLIDGRDYYRAFYEAARQARRYILIAGWRFNSDVALLRGEDAPQGVEIKFLPFLDELCRRNADLQIFVLAWDFSLIYVREWELFQEWKFQRADHQRLQFLFDNQHAVGASHHQKFVVMDGMAAFVGGLDFNVDDWDDRRHLAFNPVRDGSGHGTRPYHDIQGYVTGRAALEVVDYFKRRWQKASGTALELPTVTPRPSFSVVPSIALAAKNVALSRNEPPTLSDASECHEIRQLYLDAIQAADRMIYIENQYFSSQVVYQALLDRMRAAGRSSLDIIIILPKHFPAWIETAAMGGPRLQIIGALSDVARETGNRLSFYYVSAPSPDGCETQVLIHSKLLIVDDRFLTVGSCNISNRSMGLDTELNLSWEALEGEQGLVHSIRRARLDLLAEHTGLELYNVPSDRSTGSSIVDEIDRLTSLPECRLRRLTADIIAQDETWVKTLADWDLSFDPTRPAFEEAIYEKIGPS